MSKTVLAVAFFFLVQILFAQDNFELKKMYEEDQSARKVEKIDWAKLKLEDEGRRAKVEEMAGKNQIKTANDFFYAAMIYQHGSDSVSYKKAWEYSRKSADMDPKNEDARWLTAASYDRYLLSTGKPQIYATQFIILKSKWYLRDFDSTKATDKERVFYGTRTIKEIKEYLTKQNGEDNGLLMQPKNLKIK